MTVKEHDIYTHSLLHNNDIEDGKTLYKQVRYEHVQGEKRRGTINKKGTINEKQECDNHKANGKDESNSYIKKMVNSCKGTIANKFVEYQNRPCIELLIIKETGFIYRVFNFFITILCLVSSYIYGYLAAFRMNIHLDN